MNFFTLSIIALSVFGATGATKCVPKSGSKETVCRSLSAAGLLNIAALGCSKNTISPVIDILRRDDEEDLEERHYKECCKTQKDVCESASAAGLINLSILNCATTEISPKISILSDILKRKLPPSHVEECSTKSLGGLVNLAALDCSKNVISPTLDILKRHPHYSHAEQCKALSLAGLLNLDILNCSENEISPKIDILKRHNKNRME